MRPPYYNALYFITHAAPKELGDCQATPTAGAASILYAQNDLDVPPMPTIAASVAVKANQAPPTPGYRFVFVLGCEAAGAPDLLDHSLAQAFGVDAAGATDAGFLGFQTLVCIDEHNVLWCDAVLDRLKAGETLANAITDATNVDLGKVGPDGFDEAADAVLVGQAIPVIFGDPNMTFFGRLYFGAFQGQWYTGEGFEQPGG
ncbi:MAG TPA: hypothetical protein VFJ58_00760 [Armatimonadota bacterium]|nr:hypothetical protein [Armatimonadota bacterium]